MSKYFWVVICGLLIIALGYLGYRHLILFKTNERYSAELKDSIKYFKEHGIEMAERNVEETSGEVFDHSDDSEVVALRKLVGKSSNLVAHTRATMSIHDTFTVPVHDTFFVVAGDTVRKQDFSYNNGFLSETGSLYEGHAHIGYNYNFSFDHDVYRKREKWYQRKTLVVDIKPNDSNAHVTGLRTITIAPEPKKFIDTKAFAFILGAITIFIIKK